MPTIRVKQDEPFDVILRRFRRACEKAGIFTESRRREFYEKPTSVRKRKAAAAVILARLCTLWFAVGLGCIATALFTRRFGRIDDSELSAGEGGLDEEPKGSG